MRGAVRYIHHGMYAFWSEYFIDVVVWHKFHEIASNPFAGGYSELDYISFIIWLNITVAVLLSAATAYVVQCLFRVKNQSS